MELALNRVIRRRRFLHLSQLRNRLIILSDNNFQILSTHSPDRSIRISYRPISAPGCRLLNNCVKLSDGTPVKTLLFCGSKRNLFVSLPVGTTMGAVEISVLRLFHDEKLPILQVIESANEIAATLSGLSPALLMRVDRSLKVILSGCNRLLGTINSVSDSAAGVLDSQFMQCRRIDLVQHVRAICIGTMALALEGGIKLRYRSNVPRLDVLMDPEFIVRIMENLLSNAIKHTPIGGQVWVHVELLSDEWLRLCVIDNGAGVPEEIKGRLFERFVTGRNDSHAGAGLGLYNVRMLAEKMGGKVRCTSTPGHGARFDVDLPFSASARPDAGVVLDSADALSYCPKTL